MEGEEAKIRKKGKKPKTSLDSAAWVGHFKNKTREKTMGKDTQGTIQNDIGREHWGPTNTWKQEYKQDSCFITLFSDYVFKS